MSELLAICPWCKKAFRRDRDALLAGTYIFSTSGTVRIPIRCPRCGEPSLLLEGDLDAIFDFQELRLIVTSLPKQPGKKRDTTVPQTLKESRADQDVASTELRTGKPNVASVRKSFRDPAFLVSALSLLVTATGLARDYYGWQQGTTHSVTNTETNDTIASETEKADWLSREHELVTLVRRAAISVAHEDYMEALGLYKRALELDPDNAWILSSRSETYRVTGRYNDSLRDLNRALELDPDNAWILSSRGETYRVMGRYNDSLRDLNRALELDPDNAWAKVQQQEVASQEWCKRLRAQVLG